MPQPGMVWRHVVINTLNSWHHGDPRGFRSRDHRIHSSGDYKKPPPRGEHENLLRYQQNMAGQPIDIPQQLRATVGQTFVSSLLNLKFNLLVAAVADRHAHAVVELPSDLTVVKRLVGDAKRKSSRSVKHALPGRIWSAGGTYKLVEDRPHQLRAVDYVLYEQGDDAWTWSFKDDSTEGKFNRRRKNPGRR